MQQLTWHVLKSRDSKYPFQRFIERGEIEIWNGYKDNGSFYGPLIISIPLSECPEGASRCLHMDAKWINGSGLQCPDCRQLCFFGTFDAARWIIRQIQLAQCDVGNLPAEIKSDLERVGLEFSCEYLVRQAIDANTCQDCYDIGEIYAGCYLCDAETAGAGHTHSKHDSYFAPCDKCDKGRALSKKCAERKNA